MVAKQPGPNNETKVRVLTNFRLLNKATVGFCYPILFQSNILGSLALARYIMVVDLQSEFFREEIHNNDVHKIVFLGRDRHYQYKRMPMGYKDSPNIFLRAIAPAPTGLQGHEIKVYLGNIMVFSPYLDKHERRFLKLLKVLAAANLAI
ncbi:uncharacterized protein LOC106639932 [Copidosoma floridanum]|uniref:uncharacterized protein LOC106639932 n=1 Tax=Copidosoma floridanum TaxID=29053 RepID=UPI0006C9BA14|nr:uncharacterized protein LOC106639932 [Copidosoma floridanum]